MNMKKVATLGVLLLTGATLTACGSSKESSSDSSTKESSAKSTTKTVKKSSSTSAKKEISLENYKSIKVALPNGGTSTSKSAVESMFGKSDQSTETSITGLDKKATQYTWTNVGKSLSGASVSVSFYGKQAVAKAYTNAKLTPNSKVTSDSIKNIKTGDSLESVESKLGTPNAESMSGSGALSAQILNYTSIKGKTGASVTFTFTNNKLISTTKTSF
ncbi:DUF3862 domain-containing protein [Lactiplantibacillus plajomi]|uniref:DUF3862 domain-containing protein n=1 Tax=Lactiplantibacillus plajomi TaxID=1457217 RepID=A0ABV6K0T1_9LACO|nr:DUF3862 domain-containing protein [Lactiplantibacillus plajomi]